MVVPAPLDQAGVRRKKVVQAAKHESADINQKNRAKKQRQKEKKASLREAMRQAL